MQLASTPVTQNEQAYALDLLNETRDRLIEAVSTLSQDQWSFKAAPDRWSAAETLEHIVLLEMAFHARAVPALKVGPVPVRDAHTGDDLVMTRVPDRSAKYQVPPSLAPAGRWSVAECLTRFVEVRQRTIEFLSDPAGFRERTIDHPILGPLDSYQWVLMVALHSARHTDQIVEAVSSCCLAFRFLNATL